VHALLGDLVRGRSRRSRGRRRRRRRRRKKEKRRKERKETRKNKKRFVEGEKERDGRGGSATIVVSA
jgi:hypothetical protein